MYASMDVHTEKSIEEGRHVMEIFDARMKVSFTDLMSLYYTNIKAGLFVSNR